MPGLLGSLGTDPLSTSFPVPTVVQSDGIPGVAPVTYEGPALNGAFMPGQWLLTRCERVFGWQEQQANFMSGAYLIPKGNPLVLIEYDVRIWESGAAAIYRQLLGTVLKKPVTALPGTLGSAAALSIRDPSVNDLGITSVVVWSVTPLINPLVTSGGKGPWTAKVMLKEYRAPRRVGPIPDQTIPDPGALTPSAANNLDTANSEIAAGDAQRQSVTAQRLLQK